MTFTSFPLPGVSQISSITYWESIFAAMSFSGVAAGQQNELAPSLDAAGRNVVIAAGTALLRGYRSRL